MKKVKTIFGGLFLFMVLGIFIYLGIYKISSKNPCDINNQEKRILTNSKNWSFLGITIGESDYEDVINLLGEPDHKTPQYSKDNRPIGCVFQYRLNKEDILQTRDRYIWFSEDMVIAIQFSGQGYPLKGDNSLISLQDLINSYGFPDMVSFSQGGSFSRTLVWLHKGIQSTVAFSGANSINNLIDLNNAIVTNIYYFSPMDSESFKKTSFSDINDKPIKSDIVDLLPKDPFNWNK